MTSNGTEFIYAYSEAYYVASATIIILAVTPNLLAVIHLWRLLRHQPANPRNAIYMSLVLSTSGSTLVGHPILLLMQADHLPAPPLPAAADRYYYCSALLGTYLTCCAATVWSVVMINYERVKAVSAPFVVMSHHRGRVVVGYLSLVWGISALTGFGLLFLPRHRDVQSCYFEMFVPSSFMLGFIWLHLFSAVAVILVFSAYMFLRLGRMRADIKTSLIPGHKTSQSNYSSSLLHLERSINSIVGKTVCYLLSWVPVGVMYSLVYFREDRFKHGDQTWQVLFNLSVVLWNVTELVVPVVVLQKEYSSGRIRGMTTVNRT